MKQKQVAEIESRHLVRVMLFLSWLSFMVSVWFGWIVSPYWWIFAAWWLVVTITLGLLLASVKP